MKDFREAAECNHEFVFAQNIQVHDQDICVKCMQTAAHIDAVKTAREEGYSEAKKEVRELMCDLRRYVGLMDDAMRNNGLLIEKHAKELMVIEGRFKKSIASFTEKEQKELPFKE